MKAKSFGQEMDAQIFAVQSSGVHGCEALGTDVGVSDGQMAIRLEVSGYSQDAFRQDPLAQKVRARR